MSNYTKAFLGLVVIGAIALIWSRQIRRDEWERREAAQADQQAERVALERRHEERLELLDSGTPQERVDMAERLAASDVEGDALWGLEHLNDADARVRFWACRSLARAGLGSKAVVASLEGALKDPDEYVRAAAAHALEEGMR